MATLSAARCLVVKIGSALLVDQASGALRQDWLTGLAQDVAEIRRSEERRVRERVLARV